MTKIIDLTGKKISRLSIIERVDTPEHVKYKRVYWLCICDCGNRTIVSSKHLLRGTVRSCGCLHRDVIRKPLGEANAHKLYGQYKRDAKRRNYVFEITEEYFLSMTKQDCSYCGESPSTSIENKNSNGAYIYNGVDRKNSKEGYTIKNCTPCCSICNDAKGTMDYNEFLNHIEKIHNNSIKRNIIKK